MVDDRTPPAHAAAVLLGAGRFRWGSLYRPEALRRLERSAAISRQIGDELGVAKANLAIASLYLWTGKPASEVATMMQGVRETLSRQGHERSSCAALSVLGAIASVQHDFVRAIEHYASAIALARRFEDVRLEVSVLNNLALLEFSRGDNERAIELGREAVVSKRKFGLGEHLPLELHNLAAYLIAAERMNEARPLAKEALSQLRSRVDAVLLSACLQMWALIGATEGRQLEAARLIGWVDAAYASRDSRRHPGEQRSYERLLALLRTHLAEGEMEALSAEGAGWSREQAVNFAFERIVRQQFHAPA